MICWLCWVRSMPAARLIHCGFHGVLGLIMPRFLFSPFSSFGCPTAELRFSAFGFRRLLSYLALRLLAAFRIFYPENLPFFCDDGCSGIDLGAVGFLTMNHPRLPVALDLPMHSYPPPGSFRPRLPACFFVTFATTVSLSGIHYRTKLWPAPLLLLRKSFLYCSTGLGIPGLFHYRAAGTWGAAAVC